MEFEYKKQKNAEANRKVEELLLDLPDYCRTFLVGREGKMSPLTRLTYVYRLHKFFEYLSQQHPRLKGKPTQEITLNDLDSLETEDLERFASWIRHGGASDGLENRESSVNNYLSALNMFWRYFVTHGRLKHNPAADVERGGKGSHTIIRLNNDQEDEFMDSVSAGLGLTRHQSAYHDKTAIRDTAICLTLMRTGLRVSELVGLNVEDVNFDEACLHIIRKRNKEDLIFFDDEVREALREWLEQRKMFQPDPGEHALFLVTIGKYKGKRISTRSVQLLVKKYAMAGSPSVGSSITPHKLRATYATDMLKATGNVALVQAALNHESPTTTMMYADKRTMDLKRARNILSDRKAEELRRSTADPGTEPQSGESDAVDSDKGVIFKKELDEFS